MASRLARARCVPALLLLIVGLCGEPAAAQKLLTGQTLQPAYEGWEQNPDGTYSMWFGYYNRNWNQRLTIPVGHDNQFEPGAPDRGQPTVFQTGDKRRQWFAFKVVLPADWPRDRDLVWTVTTNGVSQKAIGSLWPVWLVGPDVMSANRSGFRQTDPDVVNSPPKVTELPTALTATVGTPLTLTVGVTDDDLPKRRVPGQLFDGTVVARGGRGEGGGPGSTAPARGSANGEAPRQSLRVNWVQWRGPGMARFRPEAAPVLGSDGKPSQMMGTATTTVTFDVPGEYGLRGYVEDIGQFTITDVTVTATAGPAPAVQRR
jgi:hypothetical protein